MNILIICGSPRAKSYTRVLINLAFKYAQEKFADSTVTLLDLGKNPIEPFRGFEEKYNQATSDAIAQVGKADVFILGVPVYNGLLSSTAKNLFEHINYKALEGKVAGFIVESSGTISSLQVQGQLVALMTYFRVFSNPRSVFTFRDQHFDKEYNLTDKGVEARLQKLVEETVALAGKLTA